MRKNKHQLTRNIPAKIKREVRVRCGFGCVICGCMFYEYDHFDPPFEDCKSHNPKGIALLCGRHHSNKTREFIPQSEITKANSNPYAKRNNFWEEIYLDYTPPVIALGNNRSYCFRDILIINNKKILSIDSPEIQDSPFRISACFFDQENNAILNIDKNSISGKSNNIDVISGGGIISIKSLENENLTLLKMSLKKQPDQFEISELNMMYEGNQITIDKQGVLSVRNSFGGGMSFFNSDFTAKPISNTFCIKIHSSGKIEGFGSN